MLETLRICPTCSTPNEETRWTCRQCGEHLIDSREIRRRDVTGISVVCPRCARLSPEFAERCTSCKLPFYAFFNALTAKTPVMYHKILRGRYALLSVLGAGGYARVWKAKDLIFSHKYVAIKELTVKHLSEMETALQFMHTEAEMLGRLFHPHIPTVSDYFAEDGSWYIVMEYIQGRTLEAVFEEQSFTAEEVATIGLHLCDILDYLHSRNPSIIFRDLKPSNIIVGENDMLYLVDFGTARFYTQTKSKDTHVVLSHGFAPPEQYGICETGPFSDIYSLGAVLYMLYTRDNPFDHAFSFGPICHKGLENILSQMTALDFTKRPTLQFVKRSLFNIQRG